MAGKKKNTGLGKGLEALFGDMDRIESAGEKAIGVTGIATLSINEIKPNAEQPRKTFEQGSLKELTDSILAHGIIQPIIVRPVDKGYEIVAGERRYRAAREANLKEVPCVVRELSDEENMLFAIIENMQREDLNPVEEAEGIEKMISAYSLTQVQISESIGKSRPYITNALRLLKLPDEVKKMMITGELSRGHGRTLLAIKGRERQVHMAQRAVKEGLSVRALEEIINEKSKAGRPKPRKIRKNADIVQVEEDLKMVLGTKVNLKQNGRKGKIEIEYYSRDELERLIELLKNSR